MSLIRAGIAPHSPILLPDSTNKYLVDLSLATKAFKKIMERLTQAKPDYLIIFSPHGVIFNKEFSLNIERSFTGSFEEFGDLINKYSLSGAVDLAAEIIKIAKQQPLRAISVSELDYGTAVPLAYLPQPTNLQLLPIYSAGLSLLDHYNFGKLIGQLAQTRPERIAILASADLSHRLNRISPAGFHPKAKWFDKRVLKAIEIKKIDELIALDEKLITDITECGLKTILMLLGAISETVLEPEVLYYDSPVGVGWPIIDIQ